MDTFLPLLATGALVAMLWLLLGRTHHRTEHLSRSPFGADLEGDRDITRTLAEIDAVRARQGGGWPPRARPTSGRPSQHNMENDSCQSHLRAT